MICLPGGSQTPGMASARSPMDFGHGSVTATGNTLTPTLAITFSSSFTGNRILYLAAGSSKQNSGWQTMGMAGVH